MGPSLSSCGADTLDLVSGLAFCATSSSFIPALQQRMIFAGSMALMASTTRTTQLVTRLPKPIRQALPKGLRGSSRPSSVQVWAAQEMRRHDMRMVLEAGTAIGTFSSRRWIGGVDVPTTVLITTKDKAGVAGVAADAGHGHSGRDDPSVRRGAHLAGARVVRWRHHRRVPQRVEGHLPDAPRDGPGVTELSVPTRYNFADVWEAVSERVGDRVAVVCRGRELTYAALEERSNRLANALLGARRRRRRSRRASTSSTAPSTSR